MAEKRPPSPFAGLDTSLVRGDGKRGRRTSSPPPPDVAGRALVKATFYLEEEQVMKLERLRLARRERGEKTDKSALVREAVDRLAAELGEP